MSGWTILGLLVDIIFGMSISMGLSSVNAAGAEVEVCNVVQHRSRTFRKPGTKKSVKAKAVARDKAVGIVKLVRKLLHSEGWNLAVPDERLPRGLGAVDCVADSPQHPDKLGMLEVKVRSRKGNSKLASDRACVRAESLSTFGHSPRAWTHLLVVTVITGLGARSKTTLCFEEVSRTSGRVLRDVGWSEFGLSARAGGCKRKIVETQKTRNPSLPAFGQLEGLIIGNLEDARKAVQLASYCRAIGLSPRTGRMYCESWLPDGSYETQGGGAGKPAIFVAIKSLKAMHQKRRENRL